MSNEAAIESFLKPLRAAPKVMADARRSGLQEAALVAKAAFLGAPGAPHGFVAKKPVKVTTKVLEDTAYVKWNQPAVLVNNDTKAHMIVSKKYGGSRAKRQTAARAISAFLAIGGHDASGHGGAIVIPGVGPRAFAHHPGTKGKHFAEKGKAEAAERVPAAYQRVQHQALASIFKS